VPGFSPFSSLFRSLCNPSPPVPTQHFLKSFLFVFFFFLGRLDFFFPVFRHFIYPPLHHLFPSPAGEVLELRPSAGFFFLKSFNFSFLTFQSFRLGACFFSPWLTPHVFPFDAPQIFGVPVPSWCPPFFSWWFQFLCVIRILSPPPPRPFFLGFFTFLDTQRPFIYSPWLPFPCQKDFPLFLVGQGLFFIFFCHQCCRLLDRFFANLSLVIFCFASAALLSTPVFFPPSSPPFPCRTATRPLLFWRFRFGFLSRVPPFGTSFPEPTCPTSFFEPPPDIVVFDNPFISGRPIPSKDDTGLFFSLFCIYTFPGDAELLLCPPFSCPPAFFFFLPKSWYSPFSHPFCVNRLFPPFPRV